MTTANNSRLPVRSGRDLDQDQDRRRAITTAATRADYLAYLHRASAANTRRSYQSSLRQFQAWGGRLPATADMLLNYLLDHAQRLNPRTLALRLTAIAQWHQLQGFADPCAVPEVRKVLAGIQRTHPRPKRKARALRLEDIAAMARLLEHQSGLTALRDNALLQLGYFGALRRSELTAIRLEDLLWPPEGVLIRLPRSKTDQVGAGETRAVPRGGTALCPVRALQSWLQRAAITSGPIFQAIDSAGRLSGRPLHPASLNPILKRLAAAAGIPDPDRVSGHSLRRGFSTSAARAGADFAAIKKQGGWKNDRTVREYIDEGQAFVENAAGILLTLAETAGTGTPDPG